MSFLGSDPHAGEKGSYVLTTCGGLAGDTSWVPANLAAPRVSAVDLARQASSLLPLPVPTPHAAPDRDTVATSISTIVNLHTWLWVDRATWGTRTRTTAVPGLSVTVTAVPVAATWDLGDTRRTCGAGTPYTDAALYTGDPFGPASPDCDYQARTAGTRTASVTTTWRATWRATDGEAGALPEQTTTTDFGITVSEYAAVILQ